MICIRVFCDVDSRHRVYEFLQFFWAFYWQRDVDIVSARKIFEMSSSEVEMKAGHPPAGCYFDWHVRYCVARIVRSSNDACAQAKALHVNLLPIC